MKARNKAVAPVTLVFVDIEHRHGWPCYEMYTAWCSQFTSVSKNGGQEQPACIIPTPLSTFELCEIAEDFYIDNQL